MPYTPPSERPKVPLGRKTVQPAAQPAPAPPIRNPWREFLDRYENDPELFVREVLGVGPDTYNADGKQIGGVWPNQLELLHAYARRDRRIAQRSGHRVGKTTALAWIINHQLVCRAPQKTVCTAPTTKQLFEALYAETVTWFNRLPDTIKTLYEVKSEEIVLRRAPTESFVSFRTSSAEKPEALAGVHSVWVLLICDEASGIPEAIYEGSIGSLANPGAIQILAGNPVRRTGLFYDVFKKASMREKWTTLHASSENHPNVTPDFVDDVRSRYGDRSNQYRVRVLGEFPVVDDDTVIPFDLIEPALTRDVQPAVNAPVYWGLDVARKGRDACALAKRKGKCLLDKVRVWRGKDTMQTVGIVKEEWDSSPPGMRPTYIFVDVIGLGAGVADRLVELGLPIIGVNVGEAAAMSDRYERLRSELWFKGRDFLEKRDCSLAKDEELGHELGLPTFEHRSTGKIFVEEKKLTMKRTGEPSPNRADAFLLTLVQDAATAMGLTGQHTNMREPVRREISSLV